MDQIAPTPEHPLMTVPELAAALRISESSAWTLIRKGLIPRLVVGRGSTRVRRSDFDAYLANLDGEPQT